MKRIIMKMKKLKIKIAPFLLLALSGMLLLLFSLLFSQPTIINTDSVRSDSARTERPEEKARLAENSVDIAHLVVQRVQASPGKTTSTLRQSIGKQDPEVGISGRPDGQIHSRTDDVQMDEVVEETAKEDESYNSTVNYHKKHILVKFSHEVEKAIEEGKKPNIPNKLKRMISRGRVWQVEVGKDESVEELLEKCNIEHSDMVQYAQLDYECSTQSTETNEIMAGVIAAGKKFKPQEYQKYYYQGQPLEDPYFLWYLDAINIEDAWQETRGDQSVVIAVVDTGAAYEDADIPDYEYSGVSSSSEGYKKAPGLQNVKLWINSREEAKNNTDDDLNGYMDDVNGFDFVNDDGYPHDDNGHGTLMANLIAYDNGVDKTGLAAGCSLMILKVLDHEGKGFAANVAEAIYYAADQGARVINLSLGWPPGLDPGPIVSEAVAYAAEKGVIMVAGTGNNSRNKLIYPAAYNEVIAVGATQLDDARAFYSNYGPQLEIMAPGGNNQMDLNLDGYPDGIIIETFQPRYYTTPGEEILADTSVFGWELMQGTSMATAMATGVVGLMISIDPDLDLSGIRNLLYKSATDLGPAGWDKEHGYGLINAGRAIAQIPVVYNMSNRIVSNWNGTLFDSGGQTGDYSNNEDFVFTISPKEVDQVTISFESWDVENRHDKLSIYDGPDISSPRLGSWSGTGPGTVTANSGAMTLMFKSDYSVTRAGWKGRWSCSAHPSPILDSWVSGTRHTREEGYNRGLLFIAHAEDKDTDMNLSSVTYGGQPMTKVIEKNVAGDGRDSSRAYVAAYILDEAGIAAAAGSTFTPTWASRPSGKPAYSSMFFQNVNQAHLIGEAAADSTTTDSTLSAGALSTNAGDMVIVAGTCGNKGDYSVNNNFTEAIELKIKSADGVVGYKLATGSSETPSLTHSKVNRQVIIGLVVQSGTDSNDQDPAVLPGDTNDGDPVQDDNQGYPDEPCQHPDCLDDLEIETECDSCLNDAELECDDDSCLNDEEIEGECLDDDEDEC